MGVAFSAFVAMAQLGVSPEASAQSKLRVVSEQTVSGFAFPESVAYDPGEKVLYVGQFGGTELKPAEKDGKGKISKVSLTGKILEERVFPASGRSSTSPRASGSRAADCGSPTSTWCGSTI